MHLGMDQGFRNGSQKVILDFTDEPSNGDTHNRSETVARLINEGVTYIAISENVTGTHQKKTFAADVGGVWIDIDTAPFEEALDEITGILTSQYTLDYTTCATEHDGTTREFLVFVDDPDIGRASDTGGYTAP